MEVGADTLLPRVSSEPDVPAEYDDLFVEGLQPGWLPANRKRQYQLLVGLVGGLVGGLLFGLDRVLVGGLVIGLLLGLRAAKIEPAEILTWSWNRTRSRAIGGLVVGLVGGLVVGLVGGLVVGLSFVLVFVLVVGLLGGLNRGFSGKQLIERSSLSPNEGIWRSGRSGLVVMLVVVLVVGLSVGLLGVLSVGLSVGLHAGLVFVLVVGLVVGLRAGLRAFVQHFTLRFWLWRLRYLPWNLVPFLDEAAKRLLLRKVGGSYIFVHRQLLDYFASLEHTDV